MTENYLIVCQTLAIYSHPPPHSTADKDSEGKEKAKQKQTPASSIDTTILFLY